MRVKFHEAGTWADQDSKSPNPRVPFYVKPGDVKEVSAQLAEYVVAHEKGEILDTGAEVDEDEPGDESSDLSPGEVQKDESEASPRKETVKERRARKRAEKRESAGKS